MRADGKASRTSRLTRTPQLESMAHLEVEPSFTAAPETVSFAGLLFDMDGTIVDSTNAIVKHWHK